MVWSRGGGSGDNKIKRKKRWDRSWAMVTRSLVDDLTQIVVACTTAGLCVEDNDLGFTGNQSLRAWAWAWRDSWVMHGGEWSGLIWPNSRVGGRSLWLSLLGLSLFFGVRVQKMVLKVNGICKWFYRWRGSILQSKEIIFKLTIFSMCIQTHVRV